MLKELLLKYEDKGFCWGKHDCGLFSADIVNEITGIDYAEPLRGTYSSEKEFLSLLRKHKCETYFDLVDKITGLQRNPWGNGVKPGDFVGIQLDEFVSSQILGINYGDRSYFLTRLGKYLKVPTKSRINKYYWSI